jgi:predicted permease
MRITPVSFWRRLTHGWRSLVNSRSADRDLRDELSHYVAQLEASMIASGMAPEAAKRAAMLEVGNQTGIREAVRASLWETTVSSAFGDVRYALRTLRRNRVFTVVVMTVIAMGIGAVTTIFSGINGYLLKPLPATTDGNRLIQIDRTKPGTNESTQGSYAYFMHLRNNAASLSGIAAWSKVDLTISRAAAGVMAYGNIVSDNYFSVLGVKPALGRFFLPGEDQSPGSHALVVVSHDFWRTHLGGDSAAVGQTVGVNGRPYTLIGVAAPGFDGVFTPLVASAWVTFSMQPHLKPFRPLDGRNNWLWMYGRLAEGVDEQQANTELHALLGTYVRSADEPAWARDYTGVRTFVLRGLPDDAHKTLAAFLKVLFAASILVLIIAGVNVAAMLSARAVARRHEMALRAALGAQRTRLVRQLVTETLVLFAGGSALGIGLAWAASGALERMSLPSNVPFTIELPVDVRVLLFAVVVALVAGVLFGLLPALRAARHDLQSQLRNDSSGSGRRRPIVSNVLVVGQLALSLVLLVSAGLLVRALQRGQNTNPGFDAAGVSVAAFTSEAWGYNREQAQRFYATLRERMQAMPGVASVSYTATVPVTMEGSSAMVTIGAGSSGQEATVAADAIKVGTNAVAADYFRALNIPLIEGRAISEADTPQTMPVVVINETLARTGWPGVSALGHTLQMNGKPFTVVGVVRDAKYSKLTESSTGFVYRPLAQQWRSDMTLVVRTSRAQEADIARAIVNTVQGIDRALPTPVVRTLSLAMSISLIPQRMAAIIAGTLGLAGLLLATVGLYGIVAYSVGQRRREIGIRMTLGAARGDVQRGVIRDGMKLAGTGVVIGLLASVAASRLLVAYLYGVSPVDSVTYGAVATLFIAVTLLANYLPARRAALADPMVVLRGE